MVMILIECGQYTVFKMALEKIAEGGENDSCVNLRKERSRQRTALTKTLRKERAWCVGRLARMSEWLEHRSKGGGSSEREQDRTAHGGLSLTL